MNKPAAIKFLKKKGCTKPPEINGEILSLETMDFYFDGPIQKVGCYANNLKGKMYRLLWEIKKEEDGYSHIDFQDFDYTQI